jgi:dihydroorotase
VIIDEPVRVVGSSDVVRISGTPATLRATHEPGTDLFISPGWVDLHAHVYDGMTSLSLPPDQVGLTAGVHLVADAGSSGQATIDGLARYVVPASTVDVRAWINIGSHGLVHLRETADPTFIDVDATLAAIDRHRDLVCGVKVRSSGLIVGSMGLRPLQLGRLVAREAGLPLLVHVGEAPPLIEDVLDLLGEGDVVTHCFHGKIGKPWRADGTPVLALARALDRGVLLDVGHGAASFSAATATAAIAAGFPPHSISTDIHIRNVRGPVYDLATTVTKLLACGMPLADAVAAITGTPRRVLTRGQDEPWLRPDGVIRHATVFRLAAAAPDRVYTDATGTVLVPERHVVPVATVVDGAVRDC